MDKLIKEHRKRYGDFEVVDYVDEEVVKKLRGRNAAPGSRAPYSCDATGRLQNRSNCSHSSGSVTQFA